MLEQNGINIEEKDYRLDLKSLLENILKKNGLVLEFLPDYQNNYDLDFILKEQNPMALEFASMRFKDDIDFVISVTK
jgi:hypothetical protein